MKRPRLVVVLCLLTMTLVGLLCYQRTFSNQFVYDDHKYIEDDRFLGSWHFLPAILGSPLTAGFAGPVLPEYRPVLTISFLLDRSLYGLKPCGFHVTNLVMHLACGFLFFVLCQTLGLRSSRALLLATLFVAHPVNVEAVAWVAARGTMMAMTFLLLALLAFLKCIRSKRGSAPGVSPFLFWLLISLSCFWLALLTKENAITFPVVVAAAGLLSMDEDALSWRWVTLTTGAFGLVAAVYLGLRTVVLPVGGYGGNSIDWLQRSLLVLRSLAAHVGVILCPLRLYVDCEMPTNGWQATALTAGGVVVALGMIAMLWWSWRRQKVLALGIVLFATGFAVTSNIVPLQATFSQRWVYWPLIGFLLGAGAALELGLARWPHWNTRVLSTGWMVVGVCTVLTMQECRIWRTDETLFTAAIRRGSQKERDYTSLGLCRHRAGHFDEAIQWYKKALQVNPTYGRAINLLGCAYGAKGDYDAAIACFRHDIALNPSESGSILPLAAAYEMKGDVVAAQHVLQTAMTTATSPQPALALAKLYETHGALPAAEQLLQSILIQYPYSAEAHAQLGRVLLQQHKLPAAERQFHLALQYDPQSTLALNALADLERLRNK